MLHLSIREQEAHGLPLEAGNLVQPLDILQKVGDIISLRAGSMRYGAYGR